MEGEGSRALVQQGCVLLLALSLSTAAPPDDVVPSLPSLADLDPVPREKRTWGMLSIISYWCVLALMRSLS